MLLDQRGTRIEGPQDRVLFLLAAVLDAELQAAGMDRQLAENTANRVAVRFQTRLAREDLVTRRVDLDPDW